MPCNSDYMDPTEHEIGSRWVAVHILYLSNEGVEMSQDVKNIASKAVDSPYGNVRVLDLMVSSLCSAIRAMDHETFTLLLRNADSRESRNLANWWDDHLVADAERIERERVEAARKAEADRAAKEVDYYRKSVRYISEASGVSSSFPVNHMTGPVARCSLIGLIIQMSPDDRERIVYGSTKPIAKKIAKEFGGLREIKYP